MAHIIEQANIDYSVQGLRGGEPHNKKNIGNVTLQLDKKVTIQAEAFRQMKINKRVKDVTKPY